MTVVVYALAIVGGWFVLAVLVLAALNVARHLCIARQAAARESTPGLVGAHRAGGAPNLDDREDGVNVPAWWQLEHEVLDGPYAHPAGCRVCRRPHGTRASFALGCHCERCRAAMVVPASRGRMAT